MIYNDSRKYITHTTVKKVFVHLILLRFRIGYTFINNMNKRSHFKRFILTIKINLDSLPAGVYSQYELIETSTTSCFH